MFPCGRKTAPLIVAAVLAASLITVFSTAAPADADDHCRAEVDHTVVADWGSGFQARVTIDNTGETSIDGWRVTLTYPEPVTVGNPGWGATGPVPIDPHTIVFESTAWNGTIAPGGRTGFGFVASGGGGAPSITLAVAGEDCDLGGTEAPGPANPYQDAEVYVDLDWSAQASSGGAPAEVADQATAVWLDGIGAIAGEGAVGMGLADHLDEAVAQGADLVQIVLYNLPGRDCAALDPDGELAPDEIDVYKSEFVDPIADIIGDPVYEGLDVVAVVEPYAIPNLAAHTDPSPFATEECDVMGDNGNYMEGIAYAVTELADVGVYNYLDAADHAAIGWHDANPAYDEFGNAVELFGQMLSMGVDPGDVDGIATNTAGYAATVEPYFDADDVVGGTPVTQTDWIDFNSYIDEYDFASDLRNAVVDEGFDQDLGIIIDTSRNGWGGPDRPTATSGSSDPAAYVDESRIDRRISKQDRCNQDGAGLGARPQAEPIADPNLHAYAWIKPPGLSDGSDGPVLVPGQGYDSTCAPEYGSLQGAPPRGEWFQGHFDQLLRNAWPPLEPVTE
ncbi:glycoside hydrolase family 6 protein [Glycomyces xiaoerkulensis]|uniref:glycoside hydrolase family 6 protein n=1 Tax=Glycomyces xiaoerkulensis TaxID=2038139 RepID=UPI000C264885|nr:glycoside hydrolase family 6 protein [Glycomyces xiaoerkulensis]